MGGIFSCCCGKKSNALSCSDQEEIISRLNQAISQRNDQGTIPSSICSERLYIPPSTTIREPRIIGRSRPIPSERKFTQPIVDARNLITKRLDVKEGYDPDYFPVNTRIPFSPPPIYQISPISVDGWLYNDIKRRITNKHIIVQGIERIDNKHLEMSYFLKKKQKLIDFPHLEELELFHGTKWRNAESICTNNFNWRLNGSGTGNRFGKGVSFSCNAMYAAHYSQDEPSKVMFIAKVLIGKKCLGAASMDLPRNGYDTTTKDEDNIVVVKYEDNEFYPCYRIRFHISPGYVPLKKKNYRYRYH